MQIIHFFKISPFKCKRTFINKVWNFLFLYFNLSSLRYLSGFNWPHVGRHSVEGAAGRVPATQLPASFTQNNYMETVFILNTAWPISFSLLLANSHILINPFLIICVAPRGGGLPRRILTCVHLGEESYSICLTAFFLPAFYSVFPAYRYSDISGQAIFFIN